MAWNNLQQIISETINRHATLIDKRVKADNTLMPKLRWIIIIIIIIIYLFIYLFI